MGGLSAMDLAWNYPDLFQKVGVSVVPSGGGSETVAVDFIQIIAID